MDNEESNKVKLECDFEEILYELFCKRSLGFFPCAAVCLAFAEEMVFAPIYLTEGNVQVLIPDTVDWTPASINLPIAVHNFRLYLTPA